MSIASIFGSLASSGGAAATGLTTAQTAAMMAAMTAIQTAVQISTQNKMAEAESEAAVKSANADYMRLAEQETQVNQQSNLEEMERERQALRERARLKVAMEESGVAGVSPIRELANSFLQQEYDESIIETNRGNKLDQSRADANSVYTTGKSRINSAKSKITNPLAAGLQIGLSGVSGYASGYGLGKTLRGDI
jgi:hypothetical protein